MQNWESEDNDIIKFNMGLVCLDSWVSLDIIYGGNLIHLTSKKFRNQTSIWQLRNLKIKFFSICMLSFFSLSQWYNWNYCYDNFILFSYMLQESCPPVEVTKWLWIVPEWSTPPVWSSHSLSRFCCSNFSSFIGYPALHCFCRSLMS